MGKGELFEGLVAAVGFFAACTIIGYIKENYFEAKKPEQSNQYGGIDDDDGDLGDFPFTSPGGHYFTGGAGAGSGLGGEDDDGGLSEEQANMGAIETLVGTADMLVSQGRFEDAKDQYLRALDLVKATMGSSVPLVGYINHELGTICRCMSHYVEADQHFGASAAIWGALYDEANKKVNPENNLTFKKMLDDVTDDVMSNNESPLLLLLSYCTNYARALSDQAEVKTLVTRSQAQIIGGGGDGGSDARPLSEDEVADILVEARKMAEEAINVYSKCFGRPPEDIKHKKVLAGHLRTLTQVAMFQKQWGDAEAAVKESLKLLLDSTYPKDPEVITCRMWLSQILMGMNKSEECISVAKELLEVHKGSPEESYFLRYLGEIYSDCDRVSDAEDCFNESLKVCDENLESEGYVESLTLKERKELESEKWEIVNSIATLYRNTNRVEESDKILSDMCERMHCDTPPYTTTSFLRTLQCSIKPYNGSSSSSSSSSSGSQSYVYGINVLIRQRNEKKVPAGSFLIFSFEDPQSGEMVPMRIEKCVEDSEKTVAMSSPDFVGMRGGKYYKIAIKVLASDHETLLSEHVQLVKCEPLTLSL